MAFLRLVGIWLERLRPVWVAPMLALGVVFDDGRYLWQSCALLAALWLLTGLTGGGWLRRTPFDGAWLLWALMFGVTWWATAVPELTRSAATALIAQSIAYWTAVLWVRNTTRATWAVGALLAAGAALALLSPFWSAPGGAKLFAVPAVLSDLGRRAALPVSLSINQNILAGVLVPLWPLALATAVTATGRRRLPVRLAALGVAFLIGLALLFLQSRGALLAAALSAVALACLRYRRLWWGMALLPVVGGALAAFGVLGRLWERFAQGDALGGLDGRLEIWSRAVYAVQDFSFTGIGMGTFPRVIPLLYPYFLLGPGQDIPHAHNLLLQIAVDLGLPGLTAFLWMALGSGLLTAAGLRRYGQTEQHVAAWLLRGCAAGLIAALLHGIWDAPLWNTRPAFLIWGLWGVLVGLSLSAFTDSLRAPPPAP